MWSELARIFKSHEIIRHLIDQEQKVQHRDKILGNVWMLLNPLFMSIVLYLNFTIIRKVTPSYILYLFSGMVAWEIVAKSLTGCSMSIRNRRNLIHKFPLPLGIFPASVVLHKIHDILFGLLAYTVLFFIVKYLAQPELGFTPSLLLLPCWIFFFLIFLLGLGYLLAGIGVYLADLKDILDVLIRVGFFLNPIFLDLHLLPVKVLPAYFILNPLAGYLVYARHVFPGGGAVMNHFEIPIPYYPVYLGGITIAIFFAGFWIFQRGARQYAKYI